MHQSKLGPIITDPVGIGPKSATRTEGASACSVLVLREGVFIIASGFYDLVLVGRVLSTIHPVNIKEECEDI